jgi:uncharacterized protein YcgI (DUF1989 family)
MQEVPAMTETASGKIVLDYVLPEKTGCLAFVAPGEILRITDIHGRQVVDMAVFNRANPRDKLSTSYSRTRYKPAPGQKFVPRDKLLTGDILLSTICTPLMRIGEETAERKGIHDVHHRMCNRELYEYYGYPGRTGCHEAIADLMAPFGLLPEDIPDTLDLFMNYHHDCAKGHWVIEEGVTNPGDYIEFEAIADCIVALSNCPMDVIAPVNGFKCSPVHVQVRKP